MIQNFAVLVSIVYVLDCLLCRQFAQAFASNQFTVMIWEGMKTPTRYTQHPQRAGLKHIQWTLR